MIYVMSDLHGCYDKYLRMLEKIDFNASDTLYILGDVVDRGPDGIKILLDMCERANVVFLRGNHDYTAMTILRCMFDDKASFNEDEMVSSILSWVSDGGNTTLKQFMKATLEDKRKVLTYLFRSEVYAELVVNGKQYFLSHTVPEKEVMLASDYTNQEDFIWGEPDYELPYFEDKILVTGHTPTSLIDKSYTGKIYIKNNHIAIDCGAVFEEGRLGCICLDTMEEDYV